jgi:hypothetical protein
MKRTFHPNIKPWLLLAWLICQQGLCAQDPGFRTPVIPPRKYNAPTQDDIVNAIVHYQQKEKVAALADNDPLLAAVYLAGVGGLSTDFSFIERDMIRRGSVSRTLLLKIFESPPREGTRAHMIHWIRDNPWIDPETFLPLVRSWCQELKHAGDPHFDQHAIMDFLAVWGHPEDEAVMTEIQADSLTMRLFRERLQRVRNGDTKTNPNLPRIFAYRNKTLGELRAADPSLGALPKTQSSSNGTAAKKKPVLTPVSNVSPVETKAANGYLLLTVVALLTMAAVVAVLVARKKGAD